MSRRFLVYEHGTSRKFWSVEVVGPTMTVAWGRIDTVGRSKAQRFGSVARANAEAEALLREKLRKGYLELAKGGPAAKAARKEQKTRKPGGATIKASGGRSGKDAGSSGSGGVRLKSPKAAGPRRAKATSSRISSAKATAKAPRGPSELPSSYLSYIGRVGTLHELERTVDREKRRTKKLPGFPTRILIYPVAKLRGASKLFAKSLIPLTDLVKPRDHRALLPFGDDTERTWICWDPNLRKPNGEMMICFIDGDSGDERTDVGHDLGRILRHFERRDS
jgi:predicted DNA-binding WGR domain protein